LFVTLPDEVNTRSTAEANEINVPP